jgi:hypothetical protein
VFANRTHNRRDGELPWIEEWLVDDLGQRWLAGADGATSKSDDVDELIDCLSEFYPDTEIGPETQLTVVEWGDVEEVGIA